MGVDSETGAALGGAPKTPSALCLGALVIHKVKVARVTRSAPSPAAAETAEASCGGPAAQGPSGQGDSGRPVYIVLTTLILILQSRSNAANSREGLSQGAGGEFVGDTCSHRGGTRREERSTCGGAKRSKGRTPLLAVVLRPLFLV